MEEGTESIAEAFRNVLPFKGKTRDAGDPEIGAAFRGIEPGQWDADPETGMPPFCELFPLGVAGDVCYFVDPIGQVRELKPPMGKTHILGLFSGRAGYLAWAWPRWGKLGVDSFAADEVAAWLIKACHNLGPVWRDGSRIRGRGCWPSRAGGLVLHMGDRIIADGLKRKPGLYDGYVYPALTALSEVIELRADAENPAQQLFALLQSWAWKRPDVDPMLLLGWIGSAFIAGALPWRPTVFITGDKGTGKSTLQDLVKRVLGGWLVQSADTTAAGIYQHIRQDCIAVAVDEMEGESDVRKQKAALKLARLAASGGMMLRGGDRHEGVQFQARSSFLFSSINTPPLEPQDLSRMAILALQKLPQDARPLALDETQLALWGQRILSQMTTQWPRFHSTWMSFRWQLEQGGMDARSQDTFGTLLACADLMLHDAWDEEHLRTPHEGDMRPWAEVLDARHVAELEDATENWRACLNHMLSVTPDPYRNTNIVCVGQVLEEYFADTGEIDERRAKQLLAKVGLALVRSQEQAWLAVPNQSSNVRTLFQGSKWAGELSASVWAGALRQAPDGCTKAGVVRIGGVQHKCTLIALAPLFSDCADGSSRVAAG